VKPLKYTIIYSILSSNQCSWVALRTLVEALLEVKRSARTVKERPWSGFGSSFLDKGIFGGCP